MAQALECPACGMRHRLDGLVPDTTFRCERCGQKLLVPALGTPAGLPAGAGSSPTRPAAAAAATTGSDVPTVAPPPRRSAGAPGSTASRDVAAAAVAAGVTVSLPANGSAPETASSPATARRSKGRSPKDQDAGARGAGAQHNGVAWYWRFLAWVVAIPVGFVLAVVPSYEFGLISKDDVLDVFVGSGADRYARLALVTVIWAVVTAVLVQLFVEGGRWLAARRRRQSSGRERPRDSQLPVVSS